jgi:hypothetical protein
VSFLYELVIADLARVSKKKASHLRRQCRRCGERHPRNLSCSEVRRIREIEDLTYKSIPVLPRF